ncbi:MAG TPA: cold-shock protein [Candidatus Paceibacterota bacterium]|nr:cold-shock protein [Candidatus Paceibacterota bacterium]
MSSASAVLSADQPVSVTGLVKWFDGTKGYGFVVYGDRDVLVHQGVLEKAGIISLKEHDRVTCLVVDGKRGLQAVSICSVTKAPNEHAKRSVTPVPGGPVNTTVKWFNRAKGYGFLSRSPGTPDIFVHMETLRSCGFSSLEQGQRVRAELANTAHGLSAVKIEAAGS